MNIERRSIIIDTVKDGKLEIPYFDIKGERPGPKLTVLSGVHGCEYTSIAAVREFVRDLDPSQVSGRIVAVPVVNVPGFWARSAFVVPVDGKNLNRSFPGDPQGTFTDVLAHNIFTEFIVGADYVVDLHAGDLPEALEPFSMYEGSAVESVSRGMAVAYGAGHIVRQDAAARTVAGTSCAAAADIGIPGIIGESGQNGLLDRAAIDIHLAGLRNVARSIGVLDGDPWPVRDCQEHQGWCWLRTEHAGWWAPVVQTGSTVESGELLGTISDVWGGVREEVRAPEAGTVIFVTSSPAVGDDGLLLGIVLNT